MANKDKMDDLDFSELDLDGEGEFDEDFVSDDKDIGLDGDERPAKKKPDLFTLGVYGAVGLCVIGAVVWQLGLFGGNSSQPYSPTNADSRQVVIPGTEAAAALGADGTPEAPPSDPFNVMGTPEQAPAIAGQPDAALTEAMNPSEVQPVAPATLPQDGLVTGVMNAADNAPLQNAPVANAPAPSPDTQVGDTVPLPAPVPADTTTNSVMQAAPATPPMIETPVEAPLAPPTQTTENANTSADTTALAAIMTRLDAIEKRLDSAPSPAITQELQVLKQTVSELKDNTSSPSASSSDEEATPAPKKAPAKKKTTRKKSTTTAKKASTSEWDKPYNGGAALQGQSLGSVPSGVSSSYTLRAAQPDMAWVSSNDGELKQVRVGDSLPGLGTVTGISQSNGQWSVSTSGGRVSQ